VMASIITDVSLLAPAILRISGGLRE